MCIVSGADDGYNITNIIAVCVLIFPETRINAYIILYRAYIFFFLFSFSQNVYTQLIIIIARWLANDKLHYTHLISV